MCRIVARIRARFLPTRNSASSHGNRSIEAFALVSLIPMQMFWNLTVIASIFAIMFILTRD